MKAIAYPKFPDRFRWELANYKHNNNISNNDAFAEKCTNLYHIEYSRWAIEDFYKGKREPSEAEIANFSEMFGVRPEYLKGVDNFRTAEALESADKAKMQLESMFHQLIVSMGYSDSIMASEDYNFTFPPNTKMFIEKMKEKLERDKRSDDILLCDVKNDRFRFLSKEGYATLLSEIYDYMKYKIQLVMDPSKTHPISFSGGRLPKHLFEFQDDENESALGEYTIQFIPECRFYNKKTKQYESSTKNISFTDESQAIVSVFEAASSAEFKSHESYYQSKLESDYREALSE